ncbi:MAG: hypothetical protein ABSA03_06165 [Streptosporangiaceae bacterium]|jgi:hypothetical protein
MTQRWRSRGEAGPDRASTYERRGEVSAVRLTGPRAWRTSNGSVMAARRGDWLVTDEGQRQRSVRDAEFRATHRHLQADRWLRTGRVRAWRVAAPTMINTLEGPSAAGPGDWIVQSESGAAWPVPAGLFERGYSPVH